MAVTGIEILKDKQKQSAGWLKDKHDLNSGAGGPYLYLAWEQDGGSDPITAVQIVDNAERPQEGFEKVDQNLNEGTGNGDVLYLYFSRSASRKPIQELAVVVSGDPDAPAPQGFTRCDTDLNKGAGGNFVYLCYKQQE